MEEIASQSVSVVRSIKSTKSTRSLEIPKRLSQRNLLAIYSSKSKDELVSVEPEEKITTPFVRPEPEEKIPVYSETNAQIVYNPIKITSQLSSPQERWSWEFNAQNYKANATLRQPCSPPTSQEVKRFSWDCSAEDETLDTVSDPKSMETRTDTRRLSWCSSNSNQFSSTPPLTDASSLSSRPNSLAASSSTSLCSSTNASAPPLQYNPETGDLDIVFQDLYPTKLPSLDLFLGKLHRALAEKKPEEARIISTAQVKGPHPPVPINRVSMTSPAISHTAEQDEFIMNAKLVRSYSATQVDIKRRTSSKSVSRPIFEAETKKPELNVAPEVHLEKEQESKPEFKAQFNDKLDDSMLEDRTSDKDSDQEPDTDYLETCPEESSMLFRPRPLKRSSPWWSLTPRELHKRISRLSIAESESSKNKLPPLNNRAHDAAYQFDRLQYIYGPKLRIEKIEAAV